MIGDKMKYLEKIKSNDNHGGSGFETKMSGNAMV